MNITKTKKTPSSLYASMELTLLFLGIKIYDDDQKVYSTLTLFTTTDRTDLRDFIAYARD